LTVSLSAEDYRMLGERYGLPPAHKSAIREAIVEELLRFGEAAHTFAGSEETRGNLDE
jgi:hypothetical protein